MEMLGNCISHLLSIFTCLIFLFPQQPFEINRAGIAIAILEVCKPDSRSSRDLLSLMGSEWPNQGVNQAEHFSPLCHKMYTLWGGEGAGGGELPGPFNKMFPYAGQSSPV